ncbi:MAG TPA: hypothetical protein VHZ54_00660 [Solirubrobacterales bacterium]|jgi:tetrahydromethanopterin S-methyltransferase subunit G|nr:hypothetical protein [Solirubrobacterales bacterium]
MQALSDDQHIQAIDAKVDKVEKKVEDGFSEMRAEFNNVRSEMRAEFNNVRSEMRADFREARGEIGALHRLMIQLFSGMFLTMILGFATLLLQHYL